MPPSPYSHRMRWLAGAALAWGLAACSAAGQPDRPATIPATVAALEKTTEDVPIGPDGQVVDVYQPPGTANGKLLVWVHGGAWTANTEEEINAAERNQAPRFLVSDQGWTAISVRYRLADGTVRLPEQIADVQAAVRWARQHAGALGIDPQQIYSMGFSAGGQLAVMAALTAGVAAFQPTWIEGDSHVNGVVSLSGAFCLDQDPVTPVCATATPAVLGCTVGACDPAVVSAARPETWAAQSVRGSPTPRLRFVAGDADPIVDSTHTRLVAGRLAGLLGEDRVQFEMVSEGPLEQRQHSADARLDLAALLRFLDG